MKVAVYKSGNPTHDMFLAAMLKGCPWQADWVTDQKPVEADIGVVWGFPKKAVPLSWWREDVLKAHETVVNMDSGYVRRGDGPENYQMVGLGGLNGRADFRPDRAKPDRWEALGVGLKPWRDEVHSRGHILLIGQVPWDSSVQNHDHRKWLRDVVHDVRRYTDRPIRFRPHPKAWHALPPIDDTSYSRDSLEDDFLHCMSVLTYSSNVGVDAIIAGIPVCWWDKGSMVQEVGFRDFARLCSPPMPDRTAWANKIAYSQWNKAEMEQGLPWEHLFEEEDE